MSEPSFRARAASALPTLSLSVEAVLLLTSVFWVAVVNRLVSEWVRPTRRPRLALVAGLGLGMSSTAIGLGALAERNLMATRSGQGLLSVALLQDIAAIPILALLPMLGEGEAASGNPWLGVLAAAALGATPEQTASWLWALGLGMGLCTLLPSLWLKKPVMVAWSTPGAAVLATAGAAGDLAHELEGAFGGAQVGALQAEIGVDHADEGPAAERTCRCVERGP